MMAIQSFFRYNPCKGALSRHRQVQRIRVPKRIKYLEHIEPKNSNSFKFLLINQ